MDNKLCLIICSSLYNELKMLLESEGYDNVVIKSFPSYCGVCKKIHSDLIKNIIENDKDKCSHFQLICSEGCFDTNSILEETTNFGIIKTELCFNLLLNKSIIDKYIEDGNYLVTPGWLMKWKHYVIDTWKFDKRTAQKFFNEFASYLLLLDTGVCNDSVENIKQFSEFVGRPYDVVTVSLDYMKNIIQKIILEFSREEMLRNIVVKNKQLAEYSMIFDLFSKLNYINKEEKVIDSILDLIKMIIGAGKIVYISLVNSKINNIVSYPSTCDYSELIEAYNNDFNGMHMWTKSGKGFISRINYNDEEIGIIYVDDILYYKFKEYFLNTFLNISNICGLAISNARKYNKLITTHQNLELQKSYFQQLFKNSPEAIVIMDDQGNIQNANDGFVKLFQYSLEDIVGRNIEILTFDEKAQEFFNNTKEILSGNFVKMETKRKRKDGKIIDVKVLAYPIINDGKQIGTYVIYSDISEKKQWEEKLEGLAYNDSLTGLSVRRVFMDRLEQELLKSEKSNKKFAVIFMDLNKFKQINDSLGHEVGDKLLIETAKRLKMHVRKNDTVARMGGDEFTLLLSDIESVEAAAKTVERIINSLKEKCIIDGNNIDISVSIGISFYPKDGRDVDTLIKNADTAMYKVKKSGLCGFQLYE